MSTPVREAAAVAARREDASDRWAWWAAAGLLVVLAVLAYPSSPPAGFVQDAGIQLHLSQRTLAGDVPLRDFEHGWNAGAWYLGAGLWALSFGDPDVWAWLWGPVSGGLAAGLCVLAIGRLHGLTWGWLLGLVAVWVALSSVVHVKYATPAAWALLLLWGEQREGGRVVVRATAAAVTAWLHLELAVLLVGGLGLYDSARGALADRGARPLIAAAPLGLLAGLLLELAVYAVIGVPPGEVLRQLLFEQTAVDPVFHFGYPLLAPPDLRALLLPATVVLPFVPVVWARLGPAPRLLACLHLGLALIALRRSDASHIAAATTLMAPLLVLGVHAFSHAREGGPAGGGRGPLRARRWRRAPDVAWAGIGAALVLAVVGVAFAVESLLVVFALAAWALAGAWLSHRPAAGWVSAGAVTAVALLLVAGLVGRTVAADRRADGDTTTAQVAAAIGGPLAECTGGDPRVWVVPHPLGLYAALDLTNPTPYVVFHYSFAREHDRVRALIDTAAIPTIVSYGPWPPSLEGLAADLEARYVECARVEPPAVPQTVRVLVRR